MKVKNLLLVGVLVCLLTGCGGQMAAQTVQEAVNSSVASGVEPTDSVTEPAIVIGEGYDLEPVAMDDPEDEAASAAESAEPVELEVIIEGLQKLEELDDGYVFREDVLATGEIQPGYVYQLCARVTNPTTAELDLMISTLIPSVFSEQEQALWTVSVTNARTLEVWADETAITASAGVVQTAGIANGYIGAFCENGVELYCDDVLAPGETGQYYFLAEAEKLPDERAEALGYAVWPADDAQ